MTQIPVCFTIDAGPNIHLLYFQENEPEVKAFIESELLAFCENTTWIDDGIGSGPERLSDGLMDWPSTSSGAGPI